MPRPSPHAYDVKTKVTVSQGTQEGSSIKATFRFFKQGNPLSLSDIITKATSRETDPAFWEMLVTFTQNITATTEKYALWDGFFFTAPTSSPNNPFIWTMTGDAHPDKKDPKKRSDKFMAYKGHSSQRYHEIRDKEKNNELFTKAFDVYLHETNSEKEAIAFSSYTLATLLVIPTGPFTTLYDFGKDASQAQIQAFWQLSFQLLKTYGTRITYCFFNTGNTYATQTVPHLHLGLAVQPNVTEGRKIIAKTQKSQIIFADKSLNNTPISPGTEH